MSGQAGCVVSPDQVVFPHLHRRRLHKSVVHRVLGGLATAAVVVQEATVTLDAGDMKWRPTTKSLCSTAAKYRSILSTATVSTLPDSPGSCWRCSAELAATFSIGFCFVFCFVFCFLQTQFTVTHSKETLGVILNKKLHFFTLTYHYKL